MSEVISRAEKKAEAIERMKLLGVFPQTIQQFEEDDKISLSEPPIGAFFWLDDKQLEQVHKFEEQYNCLVYLGVRWYTTIGTMDAFLFVSNHRDEWGDDRKDLESGEPYAYVVNWDDLEMSEIGCIGIERTVAGGLKRTW